MYRLINSLSIILQKYLMKSSGHHIYIYINIYMYSYSQNYENTTTHYYVHFYCLITYNLLHVFSLHTMWLQLHIFLNVTKSRKQVHFSVGVDMSNDHWPRARGSWTREADIIYDSLTHMLVIHWAKLYCKHAQYLPILYTVLWWHCYSMLYFILLFLMLLFLKDLFLKDLFLKKLFLWCINIFYIVHCTSVIR